MSSDNPRIDEKLLCGDWLTEFPLLKRYKSGRKLLRIVDPVVFGIELRKIYNVWYAPAFIAMNLLSRGHGFDIHREVRDHRNLQFHIEYCDHPKKYMEAAEALRREFPILSAAQVSEDTIIDLYRFGRSLTLGHNPLGDWWDLVQILKYYGRLEESAEERRALLAYSRTQPEESLAYPPISREEFERRVDTEIDAPIVALLAKRSEHLAKGGWDKLPGVVRSPRLDAYEAEIGGQKSGG
jgi:hypothetical protein